MKRLIEQIACRTGDHPVLIHATTHLSPEEIVSRVAIARASAAFPSSQRYWITGQDDLDLILGLLAADGWAAEIILDPAEGEGPIADQDVPVFSVRWDGSASAGTQLELAQKQPCDTQWLLATSGTTGSPKQVRHDLASLTRTTKTDPTQGAAIRWGLLYDPRRFAGLQVVLQAVMGGSSLVLPSDRRDFGRMVSEFRRYRVNAISATPSLWRKLLFAGLADQLDLQIVTLGGEIADAMVLETLRRAFPSARIAHIYASTEAGVGFTVNDGREGFPKTFLKSPPPGVELKLDAEGQLLLRSERTRQRYADGSPLADADGWVCTGDLVEKRGDRCRFLGRANGMINVGGDKVHPTEIEDVARAVPGVVLALARARQSPIVGQIPELWIEIDRHADPIAVRDEVLERCRAELLRFKWPAVVKVVDELTLSDMGKVARR